MIETFVLLVVVGAFYYVYSLLSRVPENPAPNAERVTSEEYDNGYEDGYHNATYDYSFSSNFDDYVAEPEHPDYVTGYKDGYAQGWKDEEEISFQAEEGEVNFRPDNRVIN